MSSFSCFSLLKLGSPVVCATGDLFCPEASCQPALVAAQDNTKEAATLPAATPDSEV